VLEANVRARVPILEQVFPRGDVDAARVYAATATAGYLPWAITVLDGDREQQTPLMPDPYSGLDLLQSFDPNERTPFWIDFRAPKPNRTKITYYLIGEIQVNYLEMRGPEDAATRSVLERELPHYDIATMFERAKSDPDIEERLTALFQLAIAKGPVPEPHVLRLIRDMLEHDDPYVRRMTQVACIYFEWSTLIPILDACIERETDPQTLQDAKLVAGRLRAVPPDQRRGFGTCVNASETIWARPFTDWKVDGQRYLVSAIPYATHGLSLHDKIVAELRDDRAVLSHVEEKSGHRTLRVEAPSDRLEAVMLQHRVRHEEQVPGRTAVDVPPAHDLDALTRALDGLGVFWEQTA
jgi:hypothetical protein